jgi:hypothetical protein
VADPPSYPDEGDGPNEPTAATPLWVKLFGAIAFGVVLLFVVLLLTGRGHGPGRHGGQAPPSSVTSAGSATDHTPPRGVAHREQLQ